MHIVIVYRYRYRNCKRLSFPFRYSDMTLILVEILLNYA